MARQEVEMQRQPDTIDTGLNIYQKWNVFTMTAGVGAVAVGAFFGIPLLVGAGAASVAVDGAQMYAVNRIKDWREKRRQGQVMREQLPVVARSEVSLFQKLKDQMFSRRGTIYQRSPA